MKKKRVFTVDEKMQILREVEQNGMLVTCRKYRSLKRKSPYLYLKTFFPDFADKHPFAFSDSLSRVASVVTGPGVATCLALVKARKENEIFVTSENQKILLN